MRNQPLFHVYELIGNVQYPVFYSILKRLQKEVTCYVYGTLVHESLWEKAKAYAIAFNIDRCFCYCYEHQITYTLWIKRFRFHFDNQFYTTYYGFEWEHTLWYIFLIDVLAADSKSAHITDCRGKARWTMCQNVTRLTQLYPLSEI